MGPCDRSVQLAVVLRRAIGAGVLVGVDIVAVMHGGCNSEDLVGELVNRDSANASPDSFKDSL